MSVEVRVEVRVDVGGGEDAGEERAERAADAVDAEGVERVVVAERGLELGAGEEAESTPASTPMMHARWSA